MEKTYSQKVWTAAAIISLVIVVILMVGVLFKVLLLVLAGVLIAIYYHGCASVLHKYVRIPEKWSAAVAVFLNILLLVGFIWFVGARLQSQVNSLLDAVPSSVSDAKNLINQYPGGERLVNYISTASPSGKTVSALRTFFSSTFGIVSDLYIIILLSLFFTASPNSYRRGVVALLPVGTKEDGENLLKKIHKVLKNWIKGQLFGFIFIALFTALGLWAIGLPLILTLALIAGLGNFVPNFGPLASLLPALLLALTQDAMTALWVVGLYFAIQIIQSAVTQPLIQKKMTSVPPALIIFGQVALGMLAGFWGVLLATPIVAILKTVVEELYVKRQKTSKFETNAE